MQTQSTRAEVQAISATQSLAAVQTLLRAGLGCITFLRNLLPDDNFSESHFTTNDDSLPYQSSDASISSPNNRQKRNVNGFKIMTMTRGYTDEADKILNYLEYGIFDALQKQYLRSFIFAIYLDNKDPNNIIEAYTFNFHYHTVPGSDIVVPVMSLGDELQNLSLKGTRGSRKDPVAEAIKKGKPPTLRDVKKSVKALLKTLIHSMTQMDVLPKRRFATFKVFYTEETPVDYEPPNFQAGDAEKDKWYFMTHDLDEVPDKWSVGKIDTGHHSVKLSVTSIATYLPSSTEHDDSTFAGTTSRPINIPNLSPVQEASLRAQQAEKQNRDADARNIVWSVEDVAELDDPDADGDDDPDYIRQPDGSYVKIHDSGVALMMPVGLRNDAGDIVPLSLALDADEAQFGGISEAVPTRLTEMNAESMINGLGIDETQPLDIDATQDFPSLTQIPQKNLASHSSVSDTDGLLRAHSSRDLPNRNTSPALMSPKTNTIESQQSDINIEMLKNMGLEDQNKMDDIEMLDLETQVLTPITEPQAFDPIESFGPSITVDAIESNSAAPGIKPQEKELIDNGLECECGITIEDECCFCEGGCGRWYHVWCMGYHSTKDTRFPTKFVCFDCRVRADVSWELLKVDLYPQMLLKFKELALFRRAIKIAEMENPGSMADFAKAIGGDNTSARQLFKRLEIEGFIVEHSTCLDDLGFTETRARSLKGKGKGKGKQQKHRKNVQKPRYKFNHFITSADVYMDYFNPDNKVESRLLGLSDMKAASKLRVKISSPEEYVAPAATPHPELQNDTQTQDETQVIVSSPELKRNIVVLDVDSTMPPKKKMKISVTLGVDLAE